MITCIWQLRMARWMRKKEDRITCLRVLYQAVSILLCCHPNSTTLYHFFQDKISLLRDFVYILKTGPGSSEVSVNIPLDIRLLAVQCLCAIVGSQDTSSVSVLGRFSWLLHELGVNRGQYMGLLPCLLRSITSYVIGPDKLDDFDDSSVAVEDSERIVWIENVLVLTLSLVQSSTALQALTDNGFVALVIAAMKQSPLRARSTTRFFVETLLIQCLDNAISTHAPAFNVFKDADGANAIIERLSKELEVIGLSDDNKPSSSSFSRSSFPSSSSSSSSSAEAVTGARKMILHNLLLL